MSGGYRGLQEAGERSLDLDSVSGRPSCLPAAHFIMYLVKTEHVSSAHFVLHYLILCYELNNNF